MPLREDILNPIAGDNPSGRNLRSTPIYDKIREARREDEELPQGAWQIERKLADWPLVISSCARRRSRCRVKTCSSPHGWPKGC